MGLSKRKKQLLREFVDFICEQCGKHEKEVGELEVHRIHQGYMGGKYILRNIKLLCSGCHDYLSSADRIASGIQNRH